MKEPNLSKLQNQQQKKEESIEEKTKLLSYAQLEEAQLLSLQKEQKDIPKFDSEAGWKEFEKEYLPKIEQFKMQQQKKQAHKKSIFKKAVIAAAGIVFTIGLAGIAAGRTGFVNYFSRNVEGRESISNKSSEDIQRDLEKEYATLEKEYGIAVGKLNLPSEEYVLQDYILSQKYISIIYFHLEKKENIVYCFFKDMPHSGNIALENTALQNGTAVETYFYEGNGHKIMKNDQRYYVSWQRDGIYYVLQNCSSLEECKMMIQSISY